MILLIVLGALGAVGWRLLKPAGARQVRKTLHTVARRDILVSVEEGGSLESTNGLDIKSKVEGRTTIISIIPDGTVLTEEDVKNGRVLIEMDSADFTEKEAQQNITYQSALADYTQAKESYEIQINQNESNIASGQLTVKFGRMDFERYLGAELADRILVRKDLKLEKLLAVPESLEATVKHFDTMNLGGAARKEWQQLQSDIDLAEENVERARTEYEWSRKLGPKDPDDPEIEGKGYVSKSEVDADRLALKSKVATAAQAQLTKEIFLKYDLPKQAEKLFSDYAEAERELERIKAKARAELAQADSRMKSKEAALQLQTSRLQQLRNQIKNCVIRAPKPGMVVYASTGNRYRQETIEEGVEVRERQLLLQIPDPTSMAIKLKVNESHINKIKPGQRVKVVAEPFPNKEMSGVVTKVAQTPDPQSRWLSPDTQTYTTTIELDDPDEKLKPGMSARGTIIVDRLDNVVSTPVQAVFMYKGIRVCYVDRGMGKPEARAVEIGQANNDFIEIVSGLEPGEQVWLNKPLSADEAAVDALAKERAAEKKKVETEAAEASRNAASAVAPSEAGESEESAEATPAWITALPEQFRDRVLERWRQATPEERKEMEKKVRERQRNRQQPGNGEAPQRGGPR